MSIFNWGIYGGYGIAFPVGRYVPVLNAWDLVSCSLCRHYRPCASLSVPVCFISETDVAFRWTIARYPSDCPEIIPRDWKKQINRDESK